MKILLVFLLILIILSFLLFIRKQNFDQKIKILVISLPASSRRERVKTIFDEQNLQFEFIDGVKIQNDQDLANILKTFDINEIDHISNLKWGDVGCGLAFLNACKYIIDNNIQNVLLCEDDPEFKEGIEVFKTSPETYLGKCNWLMVHPHIKENYGMNGQIVNIEGAKQLWDQRHLVVNKLLNDIPIDISIIDNTIGVNIDWCDCEAYNIPYILQQYYPANDGEHSERIQLN